MWVVCTPLIVKSHMECLCHVNLPCRCLGLSEPQNKQRYAQKIPSFPLISINQPFHSICFSRQKSRKPQPTSVVKRAIRGIVGGIELFVANVTNVSEDRLKTAFEKFGDVVSVTKPRLKQDIAFIIMHNFFEARKGHI